MSNLKAILFDLDDTLFPEMGFVKSGFRYVARCCAERFSLQEDDVYGEFMLHHRDGKRGKIFDEWLAVHRLPVHEHRDWMIEGYRHHEPHIQLHAGVEKLLSDLSDQGFALGLVSDGPWRMQRTKFRALGLASHFRAVQFSDELGRERWKPHPAPYERVLEQLHVTGQQSIYVGDNPTKDFYGARRLGMGAVRVRYPNGVYAGLEAASLDHQPHVEIDDVTRLGDVLGRFPLE